MFILMLAQPNYKQHKGYLWRKVFYHNNTNGEHGFANEAEAKYCINDPNKYSILSTIDSRYKFDGVYEFIIEYPELGTYNRWQQKDNPLEIKEDLHSATVLGFKPIETYAGNPKWGGLSKTIYDSRFGWIPCLLNGIPSSTSWFYAIGQYKNIYWTIGTGEKRFYSIPSNRDPVSEVVLWIRTTRVNTFNNAYMRKSFFLYTCILL